MRRLVPSAGEVDPYEAYRLDDPKRTWLRLNMVTSLDGRVTDHEGISGSLGGDADRAAFFAMRAQADAVLAGAGTVRAEGYGPMRPRPEHRAQRERDGRTEPPAIVVVSGSLDLDTTSALFTEAVTPTIVLAPADADADRVAAIEAAGGVVVAAGEGEVDLTAGLDRLRREHGLHHILCEGGPRLNGRLLSQDLVDEVCVTFAPLLAGGKEGPRLAEGLIGRRPAELTALFEQDGELLARYRLP